MPLYAHEDLGPVVAFMNAIIGHFLISKIFFFGFSIVHFFFSLLKDL